MKKKNIGAATQKIVEIWEASEKMSQVYADRMPFDFPCPNDDCSEIRCFKERSLGIAWKTKNGYGIYCYCCGQEENLDQKEFKKLNAKLIRKETKKAQKKLTKTDPEFYADFHDLDDVANF